MCIYVYIYTCTRNYVFATQNCLPTRIEWTYAYTSLCIYIYVLKRITCSGQPMPYMRLYNVRRAGGAAENRHGGSAEGGERRSPHARPNPFAGEHPNNDWGLGCGSVTS